MATDGNPAQCLMRRNRSSSAAATSFPSTTIAAAASAWWALMPRMIMIRKHRQESLCHICSRVVAQTLLSVQIMAATHDRAPHPLRESLLPSPSFCNKSDAVRPLLSPCGARVEGGGCDQQAAL